MGKLTSAILSMLECDMTLATSQSDHTRHTAVQASTWALSSHNHWPCPNGLRATGGSPSGHSNNSRYGNNQDLSCHSLTFERLVTG